MKRSTSFLLLITITGSLFAQRVDSRRVSFEYTRLPLTPLSPAVGSYNGNVILEYEASLAAKKKADEQAYQQQLQAWQEQCKTIDNDYTQAMKVYNSKSAGTKILEKAFLEEEKPTKQPYPPKPVQQRIWYPKVHNTGVLASKYIKLDGYEKGETNPVTINMRLSGTELGTEVIKEEKKKQKQKDGSYVEVFEYYYQVQMKHPMGMTVTEPTGSVVYDEFLPATNNYVTYNSVKKTSRTELVNYWATAKYDQYDRWDQQLTENNLALLKAKLNSKFGYSEIKRSAVIYVGKGKKHGYNDYERAYTNMMTSLPKLNDDNGKEQAMEGIRSAVNEWETALQQINLNSRKARVNDKVASATYINLCEAYIWLNEFSKAENALNQVMSIDKSKYVSVIPHYKNLLEDQRARYEANN